MCLQQIGEDSGDLPLTRQWRRSAAQALAGADCVQRFPWAFSRVLAGEWLVCNSIDGLPVEAVQDRQVFQSHGIQSAVLLPLEAGGRVLGGMSVVTLRPRTWADRELTQLELVAEVLSNAAARQQAEVEVQRTRQKIAHLARLSSMGELTASLAHQLSQPLTGILNNAEGARRFIDSGRATIPDLREIITDIVEDDRRAGDVLRRVRDMVARTEWSPVPLDANTIVQDVSVLIASDAVFGTCPCRASTAPGPLIVIGNKIDLQQVLLNVVTNAMDAVADRPVAQRLVTVQTTRCAGDWSRSSYTTVALDCQPAPKIRFSNRSSPRSRPEWAWDWLSRARWSTITAARFGRPTIRPAAPY